MAWLVAGLGNPDERYARTRHNLGRMVVEEIAREEGERFRKVRFLPVESAEIRVANERVVLARSTRYMNESGPSYASLAKKQGIDLAHLVAVHDELDIPAGTIRVKRGGGNSGHNGLRSLDQALKSPDYLRVRVGIGRPPGRQDPADFVLQPVAARDASDLGLLAGHAADAVRALVSDGLERTQDRFNRSGPSL
jgi:peptidyl-tRNA hydrolase, PTH1 family